MEEKPDFMALLGRVRESVAELFNVANAMPKKVMRDISSETGSNGLKMEDVSDERDTHHGQKSWSERGTKGASQAANATNEKIRKTRGTTVRHYTSSKLHHRDMRGQDCSQNLRERHKNCMNVTTFSTNQLRTQTRDQTK